MQRLDALRSDFSSIAGRPFQHFYCPILFRDEDTALCQGHLVSDAFVGNDGAWTVQRKDVDEFFGAFFESDFQAIQERGKHHLFDIIKNPKLSRLLRPRILREDQEVAFYVPAGKVPAAHSPVTFNKGETPHVELVLKLRPSDFLASQQAKWQIGFEKDVRLPALVSILHSAHLIMFNLLGYRYALSAGGHFMGSDVLGKFVEQHAGKRKREILAAARKHFSEFCNLARPVLAAPSEMTETNTDPVFYWCSGTPRPWAFVLFIKTGDSVHAAIVPTLTDPEGAARFYRFLKQPQRSIEVQHAKFKGTEWEVARQSTMFEWPEAKFN